MKRDFETWMKAVDNVLLKLVGCESIDLPDWDYWANWDGGTSPIAAAKLVIENASDY